MKSANIFTSKVALVGGSLAIASAVFSAMPAQAAEKSLELTDKTNAGAGDYPTVTVDLKDVSGGVEVTVNVNEGSTGYTGDLRAVWFDLPNPGGVTVSGVSGGPVTGITGAANATNKGVSNNAGLNGMNATFNLGVEIGKQGISKGDDYQTATFTLSGVSVADFSSDIVGTRLMSVGNDSNGRGLSSKTGTSAIPGNYDTETSSGGGTTGGGETPSGGEEETAGGGGTTGGGTTGGGEIIVSEAAPEPLTIAGTILGGGALAAWRKRKGNKNA
jgi:hypothetical protein